MGNQVQKTHVANASNVPIQAKVTTNWHLVQFEHMKLSGGGGVSGASANVDFEKSVLYANKHREPGFTTIEPHNYVPFDEAGQDGKVYLTILGCCDNLQVANDSSMIVAKDGALHRAQHGHLWVDEQGHHYG